MATKHAGDTNIRWASKVWNPTSGCTRLSAGCDNCYAFELAEKRRGTPAFPVGFDTVEKPWKLDDPRKWKQPADIFVNSMSDLYHRAWSRDFMDQIHDIMLQQPQHVYICLTKRPKLMRDFLLGTEGEPESIILPNENSAYLQQRYQLRRDGYLARRGLETMPENYWPGVTIENNGFAWRADVLREIPTLGARTISAEPLLSALPSLNLAGLGWVIVGGESGLKWRPMLDEWARDLRDRCAAAGVPFFFKQHNHRFTERGIELDGVRIEQRPSNSRWDPPAGPAAAAGEYREQKGLF